MKLSNYNFFFKNSDNKILAYNSFTNSIATLSQDLYNEYLELKNNKIDLKDPNFIDQLYRGGFLIDDNVDELSTLRYLMFKDRFDKKSLNLTIAPTIDCNFRCIYCYEKNNLENSYMDIKTQNNILKLIESKLPNIDTLNISWYGGEPLLAIDTIYSLSDSIIKLCQKFNVAYNSSMVTNGYLLNRDICKNFKKYKITLIQITLDGDESVHDKRRYLSNGGKTYKKILQNLIDCKDILPHISLRINIDNKNKSLLTNLITDLNDNDLLSYVAPYLGHVRNDDDCYNDNLCLKNHEYAELEYKFQKELSSNASQSDPLKFLPRRLSSFCGADNINSHIIDSKGDLYRCWNDIGNNSKVVGNINSDNLTINTNLTNYILYDATLDKNCSKCKFIPLCMGGCPIQDKPKNCTYVKYMLEEYISDIYLTFQEKVNKEELNLL